MFEPNISEVLEVLSCVDFLRRSELASKFADFACPSEFKTWFMQFYNYVVDELSHRLKS